MHVPEYSSLQFIDFQYTEVTVLLFKCCVTSSSLNCLNLDDLVYSFILHYPLLLYFLQLLRFS